MELNLNAFVLVALGNAILIIAAVCLINYLDKVIKGWIEAETSANHQIITADGDEVAPATTVKEKKNNIAHTPRVKSLVRSIRLRRAA